MCFVKQRVPHGAVGLFLFPIAAYGAARIGKPDSPWAKRFYGELREAASEIRHQADQAAGGEADRKRGQ